MIDVSIWLLKHSLINKLVNHEVIPLCMVDGTRALDSSRGGGARGRAIGNEYSMRE